MLGRQFTSKHIFRFVVETQAWVLAPTGSAGQRQEVGTTFKHTSGVRVCGDAHACTGCGEGLQCHLSEHSVEQREEASKGLHPLAQQFHPLKGS